MDTPSMWSTLNLPEPAPSGTYETDDLRLAWTEFGVLTVEPLGDGSETDEVGTSTPTAGSDEAIQDAEQFDADALSIQLSRSARQRALPWLWRLVGRPGHVDRLHVELRTASRRVIALRAPVESSDAPLDELPELEIEGREIELEALQALLAWCRLAGARIITFRGDADAVHAHAEVPEPEPPADERPDDEDPAEQPLGWHAGTALRPPRELYVWFALVPAVTVASLALGITSETPMLVPLGIATSLLVVAVVASGLRRGSSDESILPDWLVGSAAWTGAMACAAVWVEPIMSTLAPMATGPLVLVFSLVAAVSSGIVAAFVLGVWALTVGDERFNLSRLLRAALILGVILTWLYPAVVATGFMRMGAVNPTITALVAGGLGGLAGAVASWPVRLWTEWITSG